MAKNLTAAVINKESKALEGMVSIEVTSPVNGETYTLKIDKHIRKTKTMKLISELLVRIDESAKSDIMMEAIFVQYVMVLILKHFSSLGKDMPKDMIGQVEFLDKLVDLEILAPIMSEFDQDGVEGIFNQINETIEKIEENNRAVNDRIAKLEMEMEYNRIVSEGNDD